MKGNPHSFHIVRNFVELWCVLIFVNFNQGFMVIYDQFGWLCCTIYSSYVANFYMVERVMNTGNACVGQNMIEVNQS